MKEYPTYMMTLMGLAAATLGAGIAAGAGSLLGSGVNAAGGVAGIKLQNKYNKEMYAKQLEDERENAKTAWARQQMAYEKTRQDQSYESQLKQMKAAGLSTGLMYSGGAANGKGGAGTMTTAPQAGVPSAMGLDTSGLRGLGDGIANVANIVADTQLKVAQAKNLNVDSGIKAGPGLAGAEQTVENLRTQGAGIGLDNAIKNVELEVAKGSKESKITESMGRALEAAADADVADSTREERISIVAEELIGIRLDNLVKEIMADKGEAEAKLVWQEVDAFAVKLAALVQQVANGTITAEAARQQAATAQGELEQRRVEWRDKTGRSIGERVKQIGESILNFMETWDKDLYRKKDGTETEYGRGMRSIRERAADERARMWHNRMAREQRRAQKGN